MPTYDYKCEDNGKIIEVKHRMSENISTWGQLCEVADINPENTPLHASVKRLPTGGNVLKTGVGKSDVPPCQSGGGCPSGACGFN